MMERCNGLRKGREGRGKTGVERMVIEKEGESFYLYSTLVSVPDLKPKWSGNETTHTLIKATFYIHI